MRTCYGRGFRLSALVAIAIGGFLMFAPQASAQPFVTSSTTVQASPAAATTGEQVTLTATVTCPGFSPGGLGVTFFDGPSLLETVPVDAGGQAALTTSFSTTGTHEITTAYNGDSNCAASNDTTSVEVSAAPAPPTPTPPGPSTPHTPSAPAPSCNAINFGSIGDGGEGAHHGATREHQSTSSCEHDGNLINFGDIQAPH